MIVADSSYLVEGLLKNASFLESEEIIAPDLAFYEVINSVWKHEVILKDIKDGKPYLKLLFELVTAQWVRFVRPDEKIVKDGYRLSLEKRRNFYDTIFVALALDLGLPLKTLDDVQRRLMV